MELSIKEQEILDQIRTNLSALLYTLYEGRKSYKDNTKFLAYVLLLLFSLYGLPLDEATELAIAFAKNKVEVIFVKKEGDK